MRLLTLLIALVLVVCSVNAESKEESQSWELLLVFPMVWTPSIEGSLTSEGDRVDISVPFSDIWDGLSFGLMGDFYARKDRWLMGIRTNYLYMSNDTITRGLTGPFSGAVIMPQHKIDTNIHLSVNDFFFGYEVFPNLELLTGVRHTYSRLDMAINPLSDGLIELEGSAVLADEHLFDWLVGLKYTEYFNDNWGISLAVDTNFYGDNDKNQNISLSGVYRFNDKHNLWFGYRYLKIVNKITGGGYDIEIDLVEKGPQLGYAYAF